MFMLYYFATADTRGNSLNSQTISDDNTREMLELCHKGARRSGKHIREESAYIYTRGGETMRHRWSTLGQGQIITHRGKADEDLKQDTRWVNKTKQEVATNKESEHITSTKGARHDNEWFVWWWWWWWQSYSYSQAVHLSVYLIGFWRCSNPDAYWLIFITDESE